MAEQNGVRRVEGKIVTVNQHESGDLSDVVLESGLSVSGDLFVDCSGFAALLIGKTLQTEYQDWSNWLPCDRTVAVQTASVAPPIPYTDPSLEILVGNGVFRCNQELATAWSTVVTI